MFKSRKYLALALQLVNTIAGAFSQALPSTTIMIATSTYSYQETSEATIPASYQEYNVTYPKHAFAQTIQVSYHDVIDVSWTFVAPDHAPILQIVCWTRNKSSNQDCTPFRSA